MPVVSIPMSQKTWRKHAEVVNLLEALAERETEIASRLAGLRRAHGLSQEGAAHKAGVSLRQWQRWETGESEPRNSTLNRVADKFDVAVGELLDEQLPTADFAAQLERIEAKLDTILERTATDERDLGGLMIEALERAMQQAGEAGQRPPKSNPARRQATPRHAA